ncbi:TolB protein [Pseudoduganella lurida]|uniref:Tol-Pal system protein TolB n=1 Tax=Pseudoduganella lurida TaxID=1036180 RepID=A0A562RME8_9BURK|nr:Tol-Pal system beta propeller repeat protein TolB [Pseudoduganella lurida]TWI70217.1 TolB protein [Pseudoduganella lurida]
MRTMKKLNFVILATGLIAGAANAQLRVEISGVGSNQIPVAVAAFVDEGQSPTKISQVIKTDLERSGAFKVIDAGTVSDINNIDLSSYKGRGADALVVGTVQKGANGAFDVRYKLMSTVQNSKLSQLDQQAPAQFTRLAGHKIADDVYEKLTGVRGIFATRIAYVTQQGRSYRLEVADSDGDNIQLALSSNEPIISPSWSPDGTKVAYVSFEQKKPVIYVQNLITRQRTVIANEKGSNSAPAWSPDGSRIAVALSKTGNTQIFVANSSGGGLRRVSNSSGIDTEPQFSADGQSIYFTSDRSGNPQIYKMSANGGDAQRVTFKGGYNISPRVSSDGKSLAYISQRGGAFQLYVLDLASGQELRLSDNTNDQAPSFAPNGKYILYSTESGGRKALAVVSVDGRVKQRLTIQAGAIKEPTWGPFMK